MMSLRGVMYCPCAACGKPERHFSSGDVRGFGCECVKGLLVFTCQRCFCCEVHCCCGKDNFASHDAWVAMTTEEKIALATEGKALRERLQREGKIYR